MTQPSTFRLPYTLNDWLKGQQSNPNVFARVSAALAFLKAKFPHYDDARLLSELVCHDFSHDVRVVSLWAGTELVGYKSPTANPFAGTYFAPVGTPLHRLGVGYDASVDGNVVSKKFFRYRVSIPVLEALSSTCAAARDTWSQAGLYWGQVQGGGGAQYVIPHAREHLVQV